MNEKWMKFAIELAKEAEKIDEVPIGCVIVKDDEIIGQGFNRRESLQQSYAHAEMIAIQQACQTLGSWRLEQCELYVTLEPCPMCAGAIGWAQIPRIVFGATDEKRGYRVYAPNVLHPKAQVTSGILEDECAALMKEFFKSRR
jgi:tRNA(adenine34) deaminase